MNKSFKVGEAAMRAFLCRADKEQPERVEDKLDLIIDKIIDNKDLKE